MATDSNPNETHQVLLLYPKGVGRGLSVIYILLFVQLQELINHVYQKLSQVDVFDVHIPGGYLNQLLESSVCHISQVRRIYLYYGSLDDLKDDQTRFQSSNSKLQFCLERDLKKQLANAQTSAALDPARAIDRGALSGITTATADRLQSKRPGRYDIRSSSLTQSTSTPQQSGSVNAVNEVHRRFTCSFCKLVFDTPYQLTCGHRQCKSCANDQINCATCSQSIIRNEVWLDCGLWNEMKTMSETCTACGWTGSLDLYQEHICQNSQELRDYVNVSQTKVGRNRFDRSCSTGSHAKARSPLQLTRSSSSYNRHNDDITTTISTLVNCTNLLQGDSERLEREHAELQHLSNNAHEQSSSLHRSAQEITERTMVMNATQSGLDLQMLNVKENLENRRPSSTNGSLVWAITNFQDKRMDAKSERQKSIYSPIFASCPTGYKMRLRLYPNGDGTARGTHISLFLVIFRGEFDAILSWPFKFKVTFTLMNPASHHNNVSASFWPDPTAASFQRPTTSMNMAYGCPKFFSLDMFDQNYNQFVQNDTLFIKAKVNFTSETPSLYLASTSAPVANDEEHVGGISDNLAVAIANRDMLL